MVYCCSLGASMIIYLCLLPRVQVYQTIQSDRVDALEQPHDGSPGVFVSQGINQHGLKDLSSRQRNYSAEKAYGLPTSTSHHDSVQNERTRNTGNGNTSIVFVSQNVPPSKRRKLQEKIDEIFVTTGQPYDGNLWEISDYMPQWMQEYFAWHKEERKKLTQDRWESQTRILVMQCLRGSDDKCGGTADRLKSFPLVLREAHASKRLLLIHWTLPAQLEEFLLPPRNGIDWRVPDWLSKTLHDRGHPGRKIFRVAALKEASQDRTTALVQTRIQSISGGAEFYDEELLPEEASFEEVYHDVWRVFFTPSAPVRAFIESYMEKWKLSPGEYAAAHLRALYGRTIEGTDAEATGWAQHAINCASTLRPGGPFFFSSDHSFSTQAALAYGKSRNTKVVARKHNRAPLHIDDAENLLEREPSEFYDVFVDLYAMGMSRCLTYNRGGFGQWASMIGYNVSCVHNRTSSERNISSLCDWTNPVVVTEEKKASNVPLFVPFMLDETTESSKVRKPTNFSAQELPIWMTDYFAWHHAARSKLNYTNWKQTKYFVMTCLSRMTCGGISDRLKPLAFAFLQAARHRRLLFIDWEKPKPLQDFLVPPPGGVDWRVPTWLQDDLRSLRGITCQLSVECNRKLYLNAESIVIWSKIQTTDGGAATYAKQPESFSTYPDIFHGLFRAFFTPVPRLQEKIDQKMRERGLVPGQYAAVHLRNMYGHQVWRHPNETITLVVNGINCASNIFPGAAIFFASDDKFAVEAAREYGRQRNLSIGSSDLSEDPIHIDMDDQWRTRSPGEYDDTFVDLYMLGEARCVAYSVGGYGPFGSLLSYDPQCKVRFFFGAKERKKCAWMDADRNETNLQPPEMVFPPSMYSPPR